MKKTNPGNFIGYHYNKSVHKQRSKITIESNDTNYRKVNKVDKCCSFSIKYSKCTYNCKLRIPVIYFQVKVTCATYLHTCPLHTNSHREAL